MKELILEQLDAKGKNGQITVYGNRINITRKGFGGFMQHGFDGTKTIFINKLSGLQFKEAGNITAGFIQFIFSGSDESKGGLFGAGKDENTVLFDQNNQDNFAKIRDYIFEKLG
ncbi:MAG: hypothetical protein PHX18_01875 [Candidatus Gastranaerophilales bacterium]|nr:hypothetical protein [Candidatus Gastranaerophilales bacterium]